MISCSIVVSLCWESQYKVIVSLACMLRQSFTSQQMFIYNYRPVRVRKDTQGELDRIRSMRLCSLKYCMAFQFLQLVLLTSPLCKAF